MRHPLGLRYRKSMSTRTTAGRASNPPNRVRMRFDSFELDEANALLLREGQPVALAPTPFAVLCALVQQPGALITKGALLDSVWGHQFVSESVLKTAISEVRTALGDDARQPRYVETVSRRGYRFIGLATALPTVEALRASDSVTGASRALFTGRVQELARLWAAWERVCQHKRTIVWIAGDPGVGKTALVDHFVSALGDVAIARGQCVEQYGAGEPYLPVLEALAELCRNDNTLPALLRDVAPSWLLQLPWLSSAEERDALRRELAGVRPERMLRELGEFFDRCTDQRPLLLVTEDLHWSDQATIQLMDHIARRRGPGRLMWLGTFRLAEIMALDHPIKTVRRELLLHGLCEEIVLDPFSEEEVAEYVARRAPSMQASERFVRALHDRTDGLPLFVADLVNDYLARRALGDTDAAAPLQLESIAIPENLAGIIDQYVARLTREERVVLEAAAVCGVEFRVSTVATALDRDASYVASACEALARGYLWLRKLPPADDGDESNPRYCFRHSLFREVLYERIGTLVRRQLHSRTGAALERERAAGASVAITELAMHYERGGEAMAAARHYAQAAESLLHLSPAEAMRLAERGLGLIDRVERNRERKTLELSLSTIRGISAKYLLGVGSNEAKMALERAFALLEELPQHAMRGPLLHEFGFTLCLRAEYAEALALADHSEALWRAGKDPIHLVSACIAQSHVHMMWGRPRVAREWLERGLAKVDSVDQAAANATFIGDPLVTLLCLLAIQLLHLGLVEQARARLREARARARDLRQAMAQAVTIWFEGMLEVRLGHAGRIAELAGEMQALVDEFALAQGRAACQWMRGWAQARSGDPRGGYRLIRQAYEEDLRLGMRSGGSEVLGYAVDALVRAGDWAAAERQLDEALAIANTLGERVYLPQLLLLGAAIAAARGESVAARESMYRALEEARAQEAPWLELLALTEVCKCDSATAKDWQALERLLDRLPEATDANPFPTARTLLDRKERS